MVKKISRQVEAREQPEDSPDTSKATPSGSGDEKAGELLDQDERGFEEKKAASPGPSKT